MMDQDWESVDTKAHASSASSGGGGSGGFLLNPFHGAFDVRIIVTIVILLYHMPVYRVFSFVSFVPPAAFCAFAR